ncbi:MAG: hypothetical protein ISN26_07450, partial [Betaproteobacteria bacterium AqS2]|nr:hypothetical protein [Betaproteobacteria bacterium AqS2]
MPASGQPFWIDVYGSELAGLRVKAAAALAARAALDGHRVLLTERGGGQLRRGLPAALRPGDGFELFHPRGMPRDLLAVAVAAEWDEERERAFAEFAAAFDAVVCCREQPAEHNGGAAVVAGAWDGEAAAAAAKLCERIPGAAFVAATAARRPGSHPATVAAAREKHPAFAAGRDLPLYAHEPLRPPGSDEVGGELWTGVAELLAELGLPAKRERSDAAPDADMIAASRPLGDADARVKFETAQLEMNDAGAILAAELDADERFAERVEAGGAAMAEERAAAAQRRTGAVAARAEALAAAAAA